MAADKANGASERKFYCVKEASAYSGLSLFELYRAARLGHIRHTRQGQQLRFTPEDLDAYPTEENAERDSGG